MYGISRSRLRSEQESSFRNFAEIYITRQVITAVKTATRNKHPPLDQYVPFSDSTAASTDEVFTLDQAPPIGRAVHDR